MQFVESHSPSCIIFAAYDQDHSEIYFCFPSVSPHRYRLLLAYPLSYFVRPAKCQRQKRHHLLQPFCRSQPRLLKAESSTLKTSEQRLDLPSPRIIFYSTPALLAACHDQVLSSLKLHPCYVQMLTDHSTRQWPRLSGISKTAAWLAPSPLACCLSRYLPTVVCENQRDSFSGARTTSY